MIKLKLKKNLSGKKGNGEQGEKNKRDKKLWEKKKKKEILITCKWVCTWVFVFSKLGYFSVILRKIDLGAGFLFSFRSSRIASSKR